MQYYRNSNNIIRKSNVMSRIESTYSILYVSISSQDKIQKLTKLQLFVTKQATLCTKTTAVEALTAR